MSPLAVRIIRPPRCVISLFVFKLQPCPQASPLLWSCVRLIREDVDGALYPTAALWNQWAACCVSIQIWGTNTRSGTPSLSQTIFDGCYACRWASNTRASNTRAPSLWVKVGKAGLMYWSRDAFRVNTFSEYSWDVWCVWEVSDFYHFISISKEPNEISKPCLGAREMNRGGWVQY